ncbi:beta-ketoacyl-[acyl-carrier-protein] synthase family protein [Oleiagrimonas sp. C23AA]|uniref:beta-ketoacyl-[acyl-carrier-protein] synthase family protein n=1 Tax=Oleiagrimonas sp. C23AA TaxID=2719047 RepID=UPI001F10F7FC|nr:beta-ketoacyl-[acyl-carrier-protein] synthase family protein [Oleiagrimonas sp. C23AA]
MNTRVMTPLAVSAYTAVSALGNGRQGHARALAEGRGGLRENDISSAPLACWIGRVPGIEAHALPEDMAHWDCRNNRLVHMGLQADGFIERVRAARERYGRERIGVFMGTSTGSIEATEAGYRQLEDGRLPAALRRPGIHSLHSLSAFTAEYLDLQGPALTVSTACSSSAKVFAMASRMLALGVIDAAVVGGADTLCDSVLFGFNSLELVSKRPARPFDASRDGLSLGEAAGFALLERTDAAPDAPRLVGYGEASDAHHMSTPHPQGLGAELALRDALARAGLDAKAVDYINLHGTATPKNDEVEAALLARTFSTRTRASSTKGYTGHTLGAAGIVEAVVALTAIEHGLIPGNLGCDEPEPVCASHLALQAEHRPVHVALSNSFGFGGNNACLAFAHARGAGA